MTLFGRIHIGRLDSRPITKLDLLKLERHLGMKISELAGSLAEIETTLNKVKTEVEALKAGLGDVEIPAEAQAALNRLSDLSKTLDELNPDA